ncbi:hypothetical protein CDAR_181001 [Caerostris darwini]|uniref:Uncharacterized protein n=1 Tax=Caerostris darwini TaxID=1538125 RepID=A0AAV4TZ09_9ARAC|nr:hypothetical protein CDAR_181001 [Caerostris darwini]
MEKQTIVKQNNRRKFLYLFRKHYSSFNFRHLFSLSPTYNNKLGMGLSNIPNATDCTRKWKTQLSFQASVSEENECRVTVEIREYFAQQSKRHPLLNESDHCSCNGKQDVPVA